MRANFIKCFLIALPLFALIVLGVCMTKPTSKNQLISASSVSSDETLKLTWDDVRDAHEFMLTHLRQNPNLNESEQAEYMRNELRRIGRQRSLVSTFDYSFGGMNSEETRLAILFPIYALTVDTCKDKAVEKTDHYYRGGLGLGNGDAFRHTYWNALMVREVPLYSVAKDFANAHEYGKPDGPDKSMDFRNNEIGRNYGVNSGMFTEDELAERIKNIVSEGRCLRVVNNALVPTSMDDLRPEFHLPSNHWIQPIFTSNTSHGVITASGNTSGREPYGAFDGQIGDLTPNFPATQWTLKAKSGWLQIRLPNYIQVHEIEFFNRYSDQGNRTKGANFTGMNGVALGSPFTADDSNRGRSVIPVGGILTNVIRLNVTSCYGGDIFTNDYVGANEIIIHATMPASQPASQVWSQPIWTGAENGHGTITASGKYENEVAWKAYNGTMNGGSGGNGDNWSVKAKSGWLELKLNYPVYVTAIELWGNTSGGSNRTRAGNFTGDGGVWLGGFELGNHNQAYTVVYPTGVWTNTIRLNITSSYGSYVGASMIKIHASV